MEECTYNSECVIPMLSDFSDAANSIFDIEFILETILDYAIHEEDIVETSIVKSCRLVNKAWHQSTSRVLRKSTEPLFKFRLLVNLHETKGEAQLDQFLKSVTEGTRLEDHVPPHSINVILYNSVNYQSLKTVFEAFINCGSSLVELDLITSEGCNHTLLTTQFYFPKLRKLRLHWSCGSNKLCKKRDLISFTQTALSSSEQLQSFVFYISCDSHELAKDIGNLILPPTITDISLYCSMNESSIEMLVKNPLPNLKNLFFFVTGMPFEKQGIFTRILQNAGKKLERLHVSGKSPMIASGSRTGFTFPLMENLQRFKIVHTDLELEEYPSSLQRLLPKMNHLTLHNQTLPMLRKWVDSSCYHYVTSLTVSLFTERRWGLPFGDANWPLPHYFDSSTIGAIRSAFPNLLKLDISLPRLDIQDPTLCTLWKMQNLVSLRVMVQNTTGILTPDVFDALLIGISVDDVPKLRDSPVLWEDFHDENASSIRNLIHLQKLALASYEMDGYLISNLTFEFALFKMPKLCHLVFENGFGASDKMKKKWRQDGRKIVCLSDSSDEESEYESE